MASQVTDQLFEVGEQVAQFYARRSRNLIDRFERRIPLEGLYAFCVIAQIIKISSVQRLPLDNSRGREQPGSVRHDVPLS